MIAAIRQLTKSGTHKLAKKEFVKRDGIPILLRGREILNDLAEFGVWRFHGHEWIPHPRIMLYGKDCEMREEVFSAWDGEKIAKRVSPAELARASGVSTMGSDEALCVVEAVRGKELKGVEGNGIFLILDGVSDPGNVGAIFRSSWTFGARGVVMIGSCAHAHSSKVVSASRGTSVLLPSFVCENWTEAVKSLEKFGVNKVVCGVASGSNRVKSSDLGPLKTIAVAIGNEKRGVDLENMQIATASKNSPISSILDTLPISRPIDSLNAAAAASIYLYRFQP